jgi:hypothetical protein
MLRTCSRFIALTAMVAGPTMTAQAADQTLTLACQGTVTIKVMAGRFADYEPDPISMGIIVNFTARRVEGTARWGPYLFDDQLQITEWNEGKVVFEGFSQFLGMKVGSRMDRVTGDVVMLATSNTEVYDYALKCRPTQRMF